MKTALQYSGSPVTSFKSLVAQYPRDEFDSPQRSTVPSLAFWSTPEPRIAELCDYLQIVHPAGCTLEFEFKVPPPEGMGKESHTDIMISWTDVCIAVEAKYTEPPYQTVKDWLGEGSNQDNRKNVLGGWCKLIRQVTGKGIDLSSLTSATYQMIHRIASACAKPEQHKYVLYQVFDPTDDKLNYYRTELLKTRRLLGIGSSICLYVMGVIIHPSKVYVGLLEEWQVKKTPCRRRVISGLIMDSLMECEIKAIEKIE